MIDGKSAQAHAPAPEALPAGPLPGSGWGRLSTRRAAALTLVGQGLIALGATYATIRMDGGNRFAFSLAIAAIWLVCLHTGVAANATELLALGSSAAIMRGIVFGVLSVSAFSLWVHQVAFEASRILLCAAIVFAGALVWDALVRRATAPKRILIVGTSGAGRDIARELEAAPKSGFALIGFVSDIGELTQDASVVGEIDDLPAIIHRERPSIIVLAVDRNRPAIFGPLLDSASAGFRVVEAAQFSEHAFGHVPVRDIQRAWFMSVLHLYQRPYSRLSKRVFDLVVATAGLALSLTVVPLLIVLVRFSGRQILVRQVRMGEFGEPFTMLKFRTMRSDAEEVGQAVWAQVADPRVTRVGRVMRRLRLDEIPQLWNVLRGDMSIVGPRPERPEFMQFLEQRVPFWPHRQLVKPGITGWAQVRRGYTSDAEGSIDKLSYDLWYLRHRSVLVDITVCLMTVGVLLRGTPEARIAREQADQGVPVEPVPAFAGNQPDTNPGA